MKTFTHSLRIAGMMSVLALGLMAAASATAQTTEDDPRFYLGLHGHAGIPVGEFGDTLSNAGFGISAMVGYSIGAAPVVIGLEGGFMIYGIKDRTEPWSNTIPDVRVNVQTTNSIAFGHLLLRLQPQSGPVRPYLDGLAGFNYLSTTTSVNNEGNTEETIASSTNQEDVVFSYGAGGGLMFLVHSDDGATRNDADTDSDGPAEILVDVSGRYMWGGEADYLTENSVHRNGSVVSYDVKHTRTDMVAVKLGVVVRF
jgi:hypothetical protein